jgi:hypothetical protein
MRRIARLLTFLVLAVAWVFVLLRSAHAGGPLFVAGASYFDPPVKGTPLIWLQAQVFYYTDQGDLSPLLPQASANALVADAFSRWTGISTVAFTAALAGQLAEDVNGSNVTLSGSTLSLPADIQPTAVNTPLGIVYDLDGQVTEILLGTGSSTDCLNNAAYGGPDGFATNGNFAHALVILNGTCAQSSSQLFDFEYRLIRVLGHILGLGASQTNLNVWTGSPPPTSEDFAGFPVMHESDPSFCLPITNCLPNADQPKMDDRAALGRLYPGPLFGGNTGRVHGVVSFPSGSLPGQGMQGVNVVARWIDPVTLLPSRTFVATSVSGCLYRGNAGNPVTGFTDASGQRYDQWGSDDTTLQGFFDLGGLEIPDGDIFGSYEISVEPVDPLYSEAVGSYAPLQVNPSGAYVASVVVVNLNTDTAQDIAMIGGALAPNDTLDSQDYLNPAPIPSGGEWQSWFNPSGGTNYYSITAQSNRTLSVEVETVDEQGSVTQSKAQPVIGMGALTDPPGTPPPAVTPNPFNTATPGLTRLDAQMNATTGFRIHVTDWRGDGRPDYAHHMRVLYADSISPARASVAGGDALQIQGLGFRPLMAAQMGGVAGPVVDSSSNQLVLQAPALPDGLQTVVVSDPATGGFSTMTNAVIVGAGPTDTLQLLPVANPAIPIGGETPNPLQFLVVATDGTPVAGATVSLSTTNGLTLDPCGGITSCSVLSDQSGRVVARVGVTALGVGQVTAQLAPASYPNPSTVTTTLTGIASSLDIALIGQLVEVEQGGTVNVPLLARVLNAGIPQSGQAINFQIAVGQGTLSAASVVSDSNGNAPNTLALSLVLVDVQVTACIAPQNNPCKTFTASVVPVSALLVEAVSGTQQVVTQGQPVVPVLVRVTDNSTPPFPVLGANLTFLNVLSRSGSDAAPVVVGDVVTNPNPDAVVLGSVTTATVSDGNGLVQIAPWNSPLTAGESVAGFATVDSGSQVAFSLQELAASGGVGGGARVGPFVVQSGRGLVLASSKPSASVYSSFVSMILGSPADDPPADPNVSLTLDISAEKMPSAEAEQPGGTQSSLQADGTEESHPVVAIPFETPSPPDQAKTVEAKQNQAKKSACDRCSGVTCPESALR